MSEKEKMINGEMYDPMDDELLKLRIKAIKAYRTFNSKIDSNGFIDLDIIKEILGSHKDDFFITPDIKFDYGFNIHIGKNFYSNVNLTILDVCPVVIGDNCMIGPNVDIYTATHPLDVTARYSGKELGKKITIGDNVWIGGKSVILPGINIGNGSVIAAGSIVTKDVPNDVVVAGNPAKIIKKL